MLKILYKRYYMEIYILYLLFCVLCWFLLWYFWKDNNLFISLLVFGTPILMFFIVYIPSKFHGFTWRDSYGNKECKNKCMVVHCDFCTWEYKCDHCKYCPYSVHKYQHKVFKHIRIFKNKFLGW